MCFSPMDKYNLSRFCSAQEHSYSIALSEITDGRKQSHWMWYVFPQLKGLGRSPISEYYGITGKGEAKAYLAHPLLGHRLVEISSRLMALESDDALSIFGRPDNGKLKSCMTLFLCADPYTFVFEDVLRRFFGGMYCERTLSFLEKRKDE